MLLGTGGKAPCPSLHVRELMAPPHRIEGPGTGPIGPRGPMHREDERATNRGVDDDEARGNARDDDERRMACRRERGGQGDPGFPARRAHRRRSRRSPGALRTQRADTAGTGRLAGDARTAVSRLRWCSSCSSRPWSPACRSTSRCSPARSSRRRIRTSSCPR